MTISMNQDEKIEKEAPKAQPVWMTQSTVEGVNTHDYDIVRLNIFKRLDKKAYLTHCLLIWILSSGLIQ